MKRRFISLGWKISAFVITITTVLACLIMAVYYLIAYREELRRVELHQREVRESHVPVLTASLWNYDFYKINKQMEGLLAVNHIVFIEIRYNGGNLQFGRSVATDATINKSFPLVRDNGETLGQLSVRYSGDSIRQVAFHQLKTIFIPIVFHILLITLSIMIFYHTAITRHLRSLGSYTKNLGTDNLHDRFEFKRSTPRGSIDELDLLLESIDAMRLNMIRQLEQQREMEKQILLNKKMEALGALAGGVAHDLNNILTGIVSYPEILMMDYPVGSPMWGSLNKIKSSGLRAATIVQDLLTLARRAVPTMEVIKPDVVVRGYLDSPEFLKLQQEHPEVEFVASLSGEKKRIVGSPIHIVKALMNLATNAAEAITGRGTVVISTRYADRVLPVNAGTETRGYFVLTVEDNGIGIADPDLERVFEPFFTRKVMGRSGSGLGMTVVYGTVQDHQGEIDIHSKSGEGTTISLYFPLTDQLAPQVEQDPDVCFDGRGERILVVDDVAEQREVASQILCKLGYVVITAATGEEAVTYLQNHPVDLVLLDMIMEPGMDGLDTFRKIRNINPAQKVVIVSGFSETHRVQQAIEEGARSYIRKPYLIETIAAAVRNAISS